MYRSIARKVEEKEKRQSGVQLVERRKKDQGDCGDEVNEDMRSRNIEDDNWEDKDRQ